MKVLDVRQFGEIDPLPLLPWRYEEQKELFKHEYNVELPEKSSIPFGNQQLWRAFQKDVLIEIVCDNGFSYRLKIDAGFIMDYASIPLQLRGKRPWYLLFSVRFPDNDDQRMVVPSTVHDALFAFKLLGVGERGFHLANDIFEALCVYYIDKEINYRYDKAIHKVKNTRLELINNFKENKRKIKKATKKIASLEGKRKNELERSGNIAKWLKFGVDSPIGWDIYEEGRAHDIPVRAQIEVVEA